jgi:hypothetical protein
MDCSAEDGSSSSVIPAPGGNPGLFSGRISLDTRFRGYDELKVPSAPVSVSIFNGAHEVLRRNKIMKIGHCFQIVFPTFVSFAYFVVRHAGECNTNFQTHKLTVVAQWI